MLDRKTSLVLGALVLGLGMLACTVNIGGPSYPTPAIPISTQAVGELRSTLDAAVSAGSDSGQLTLAISESQLTSYLNYQLQNQAHPILTNLQVYLRNGQIQLYGTAQQGYFLATAGVVLTAGVDDQDQLKLNLTSANFGPLPVPAGFLDILTTAIKEAYTSALGPAATGFRLDRIDIADGKMTISGRIK